MDGFIIGLISVVAFILVVYVPLIIHSIYKTCCITNNKTIYPHESIEREDPVIVINPCVTKNESKDEDPSV